MSASTLFDLAGRRPLRVDADVIAGDVTLVEPDVAVVDPAHLVRRGLGVSPAGLAFIVEITSPSTRRRDMTIKRDPHREWQVPLLVVDRSVTPHALVLEGEPPSWAAPVIAELSASTGGE